MRTVIVGDLHLYAAEPKKAGTPAAEKLKDASRDLARLLLTYLQEGPVELVLSGDMYDLAASGFAPVTERLSVIAMHHSELHEAMRDVCRKGGRVIFVPGNHDYELMYEPAQQWIERFVPGAQVKHWFYRVGNVAHIEHGNQYDPDNAHPHPLLPQHDPLGIMVTRECIHRLGDLRLLELNDRTPLPLLAHCFAKYGWRTPGMVARYIYVGLKAARRAQLPDEGQRAEGEALLAAFAPGHDMAHLRAMLEVAPRPTHTDGEVLFRRMYLGRILLGVVALFAATLALALGSPKLALATLGGTALLGLLLGMYKNVYRGRVQDVLQAAAHEVAKRTQVKHVVFGHAHKEYDDGAYLNPGSFAFPHSRGLRTYIEIDGDQVQIRYMQAGGDILPQAEKARSDRAA